jgi:hypothetical protein
MREGTTSRVMGADRCYGEFHYFYSVSPEYFGYTLVFSLFTHYLVLSFLLNLDHSHPTPA